MIAFFFFWSRRPPAVSPVNCFTCCSITPHVTLCQSQYHPGASLTAPLPCFRQLQMCFTLLQAAKTPRHYAGGLTLSKRLSISLGKSDTHLFCLALPPLDFYRFIETAWSGLQIQPGGQMPRSTQGFPILTSVNALFYWNDTSTHWRYLRSHAFCIETWQHSHVWNPLWTTLQ